MELKKRLKQYYIQMRDNGVSADMGFLESTRVQMVNCFSVGVLLVVSCLVVLFWEHVIVQDIPILLFFLVLSLSLIYLNGKGQIWTVQVLFHFLMPLIFAITLMMYGKTNTDEVMVGLLTSLGFISFRNYSYQWTVVIWNLLCFTIASVYVYNHGAFYPFDMSSLERYLSGILMITLAVFVSGIVIRTNYKYGSKILELTNTLEEQNQNLDDVNTELSEINSDLKNFVYVASHDLKAPLRSIISFQTLIERDVKELNNEKLNEYLSYSTTSARQMEAVLTDLLKYSKLSQEIKKEDLEQVNLGDIMEQVMVETKYGQIKGAIIKIDGKLENFRGVNSQVKLVMQNLIGNGIKYNESAVPEVVVSTATQGEQVVVRVRDNGIGIAPEFKEQIFEPFRRLHAQSKYEGTGFGLAITKRIVDKIGGSIELSSELGEGTEFSVSFPR